ncbi:MGMT family protein [Flavobacteriales bacterium]|nr:MGMT family protein [Flavobacteriales bacterium]
MKYIKFLLTGVLFGVVMSKAEIISWFRIYEMFRFDAFHMYGIIGSAVVIGMIFVKYTKRKELCCIEKKPIEFKDKNLSIPRYLIGGVIFGLGWAMNNSHGTDVPAHRVVNRVGLLTGKHHFQGRNLMKELLASEGHIFEGDQILNFKDVFWVPTEA